MGVKVRCIRKKADGTRVFGLKIDHDGRRQTISVGSKAQAEKAKAQAELRIAKHKLGITEKKSPNFDKIAARWLDFILGTRSTGTYTRYSQIYRDFLRINKPIKDITRGDIRTLLLEIHRRGYSRATVELVHTVASGIFLFALDEELVDTVPTRMVLRRLDLKRDRKDIHPFTADQMDKILKVIDRRYYEFFLAAYHTAARAGELCALEWGDINYTDKYIRITKTAKDQVVHNSTKTHNNRNVDLSDELAAVLKKLQVRDKEKCFKIGIKPRHVFHQNGALLSQNTLRRRLSKACRDIGMDHRTMHDIRHSTASILLSRGVPLLYVSELLGHSSPKMTLDRYSHYMPSENKGLINSIGGEKSAKPASVLTGVNRS